MSIKPFTVSSCLTQFVDYFFSLPKQSIFCLPSVANECLGTVEAHLCASRVGVVACKDSNLALATIVSSSESVSYRSHAAMSLVLSGSPLFGEYELEGQIFYSLFEVAAVYDLQEFMEFLLLMVSSRRDVSVCRSEEWNRETLLARSIVRCQSVAIARLVAGVARPDFFYYDFFEEFILSLFQQKRYAVISYLVSQFNILVDIDCVRVEENNVDNLTLLDRTLSQLMHHNDFWREFPKILGAAHFLPQKFAHMIQAILDNRKERFLEIIKEAGVSMTPCFAESLFLFLKEELRSLAKRSSILESQVETMLTIARTFNIDISFLAQSLILDGEEHPTFESLDEIERWDKELSLKVKRWLEELGVSDRDPYDVQLKTLLSICVVEEEGFLEEEKKLAVEPVSPPRPYENRKK